MHAWVSGAKTAGPIAKKFFLKSNFGQLLSITVGPTVAG
jgi:hypothetical protein